MFAHVSPFESHHHNRLVTWALFRDDDGKRWSRELLLWDATAEASAPKSWLSQSFDRALRNFLFGNRRYRSCNNHYPLSYTLAGHIRQPYITVDQRRSPNYTPHYIPHTVHKMTALIPMAMYGLEVPSGDVAIPARPDIPSAFRITMAAIDPSAPIPEGDAAPRATLKVIRQPLNLDDYSEDDDEDDEDDESVDFADMEKILAAEDSDDDEDMEDDDDEEEVNGGPSDPAKSKSARKAEAKATIMKMILADEEENGAQTNGKSAKGKGKMAALNVDFDDDDSEEDSEDGDVEEFVICTLDPLKVCRIL